MSSYLLLTQCLYFDKRWKWCRYKWSWVQQIILTITLTVSVGPKTWHAELTNCVYLFFFSPSSVKSLIEKTLVLLMNLCLRTKVKLGIPWISSFYIFHSPKYRGPLIFKSWFLQDILSYFLMRTFFLTTWP